MTQERSKSDFGWLRSDQSKSKRMDASDQSTYPSSSGRCYTRTNLRNDTSVMTWTDTCFTGWLVWWRVNDVASPDWFFGRLLRRRFFFRRSWLFQSKLWPHRTPSFELQIKWTLHRWNPGDLLYKIGCSKHVFEHFDFSVKNQTPTPYALIPVVRDGSSVTHNIYVVRQLAYSTELLVCIKLTIIQIQGGGKTQLNSTLSSSLYTTHSLVFFFSVSISISPSSKKPLYL